MSLHGKIEVNGEAIGWWYAQRLLDAHGTGPDDRNTYVASVHMGRLGDAGRLDWRGLVENHRYGDGALVLAAKVLAAAVPTVPTEPTCEHGKTEAHNIMEYDDDGYGLGLLDICPGPVLTEDVTP